MTEPTDNDDGEHGEPEKRMEDRTESELPDPNHVPDHRARQFAQASRNTVLLLETLIRQYEDQLPAYDLCSTFLCAATDVLESTSGTAAAVATLRKLADALEAAGPFAVVPSTRSC